MSVHGMQVEIGAWMATTISGDYKTLDDTLGVFGALMRATTAAYR
jgi:hypothetical protein